MTELKATDFPLVAEQIISMQEKPSSSCCTSVSIINLAVVCVQEAQLCAVEEELTLKEARWLQSEARLQGMVTGLEQELELEREQHSKEVLLSQDW